MLHSTNTHINNPWGTTGYISPEVYKSNRVDFKVDIFALGCIFGSMMSNGGRYLLGKMIHAPPELQKEKAVTWF